MTSGGRARTVVARVLRLKRFAIFASLTPAALTSLAERVQERGFAPGDDLLDGGAGAPRLHFVLQGNVEVRHRDRVLERLGDGGVVGEIDVLSDARHAHLTARATSATRSWSIDRAGLLAAQEDSFPLQRALLRALGAADLQARRRRGWQRVYGRADDAAVSALAGAAGGDLLELAHRVYALRRTRELGGLRIRTLGRLAAASEVAWVPAGEAVWRRGDPADFAVQVLRGSLRCKSDDAAPFTVASDTLLGLSEALAEGERWCDVSAASEVLTMRLGIEDILDELEDDTDVAVELMTALANDVIELEGRAAAPGESEVSAS